MATQVLRTCSSTRSNRPVELNWCSGRPTAHPRMRRTREEKSDAAGRTSAHKLGYSTPGLSLGPSTTRIEQHHPRGYGAAARRNLIALVVLRCGGDSGIRLQPDLATKQPASLCWICGPLPSARSQQTHKSVAAIFSWHLGAAAGRERMVVLQLDGLGTRSRNAMTITTGFQTA